MLRCDNEDEGQEVLFSSRNSLTNCVTKVAEIVGHKGEKFMNLTEQRFFFFCSWEEWSWIIPLCVVTTLLKGTFYLCNSFM